jgi:hypothetical protein
MECSGEATAPSNLQILVTYRFKIKSTPHVRSKVIIVVMTPIEPVCICGPTSNMIGDS